MTTSKRLSLREIADTKSAHLRQPRTRPADVFTLNHRRAMARFRHRPRQLLSGFSAPDNKDLIAFCVSHESPPDIT
jgi:hypothetical protein